MRDVGYSENTAKTPQKLTESLGFIELCEEKGLTEDLLINALVEYIKTKKGNRKAELELAFKIKGRLASRLDVNENKPLSIMFSSSFLKEEEQEKLLSLLN